MPDLPTGQTLLALARDVLLGDLMPLLPEEARLDARLATLLTDEQQQQLQVMQRAAPPGPVGPGGPGGSPRGGAPIFRAFRYPTNHAAFAGRKWPAGKTVEELQAVQSGKKESQPKK